ncbi:MAG TPA: hypothetical protein VFM46_16995 [Pseudomonadales bacterium]|nr:hypothetical protein [Pseudomonadales bacterium]
MRLFGYLVPLWLGGISASALAGQWHYNGFVSQSVINTSDNNFFGRSDDALNTDFRELALILTGSPVQALEGSMQVLSRSAGTADNGAPRIDYAFVSWRFQETVEISQGFSLGKVKVPYGFFNETRESPFGRQHIWLAQSIYPDRSRNSQMTANELLYFGEYRGEDWTFGLKAGYGKAKPDPDELTDYFQVNAALENFSVSSSTKWNAQLTADYGGGRFRAALSRVLVPIAFQASLRFPNAAVLNLDAVVKTYINVLSLEWNEPAFSVSAEIEDSAVNYAGLTVDYTQPDYRNYPQGANVELRFHATPSWDIYTRFDGVVFDKNDRSGEHFQRVTGAPSFTRFAYDKVLGAAYRPSPDWLIMAEAHRVNGTMWGTARDMPEGEMVSHYWNMAALTVAWRF